MSEPMRVYFLEYLQDKLFRLLPTDTTLFDIILVYLILIVLVLYASHKFRTNDSYVEVFSTMFLTMTFVTIVSIFVY